jgi:hypothetical protein
MRLNLTCEQHLAWMNINASTIEFVHLAMLAYFRPLTDLSGVLLTPKIQ